MSGDSPHKKQFIYFRLVPNLEHRAPFGVSVITHTRHTVGLLWMSDQPSQRPLPTQDNTTYKQETNIHAPSGIRTCDPSTRAATGISTRNKAVQQIGGRILSLHIVVVSATKMLSSGGSSQKHNITLMLTGPDRLRMGSVTCFCELGNEPSASVKSNNFMTSWAIISVSRRHFCELDNETSGSVKKGINLWLAGRISASQEDTFVKSIMNLWVQGDNSMTSWANISVSRRHFCEVSNEPLGSRRQECDQVYN
jgi:hypothetical protein